MVKPTFNHSPITSISVCKTSLKTKAKNKTFDGLTYTYQQIVKADPKKAPKPDPFFWHGTLIEGTGCFFPGTNVLVPGTGIFKQKNSDRLYASATFKITRPGYYRIITLPAWDNKLILSVWDLFTTENHNKKLEPYLRKRNSRYAKRMARIEAKRKKLSRPQLKKSEKRLAGQVIRDQKDFVLGLPKANGTRRREKERNKVINKALSETFKVSTKVIRQIRSEKERHSKLVNSGLAWARGRYKKNRLAEKIKTHRAGEPYPVVDLTWMASELYGVEVPIAYTKPLSKAQTEFYQPAQVVKTGFDWWEEVGKKLVNLAIEQKKWSPFLNSQVETKPKQATPTAAPCPCDAS